MVHRIYVEKKPALAQEARSSLGEIREQLNIRSVEKVRVLNRYDLQGVEESLLSTLVQTVFSEPQLDDVLTELPEDGYSAAFGVEFLPGQFDQRADSAEQCVRIITKLDSVKVKTAKVFLLYGALKEEEVARIKKHLINPVESREADLNPVESLSFECDVPADIETVEGFITMDETGLLGLLQELNLAMDMDDLLFTQQYFQRQGRNPTLTEIRILDTYWSDHCRHTTFLTHITDALIEDERLKKAFLRYQEARKVLNRQDKPVTLMDIATVAGRYLKKEGYLDRLDESDEINACTVKIDVDVDGELEEWLLLFKNETHNHPTEIEPFGGAATCIGGAIRDPLSGRAYVYAAMRLSGAGDPTVPIEETLPGKLSQRSIVTGAWAGYSSYGNQIGLATGQVDELYHPGYIAKHMEVGAVLAAAPAKNVRRETPVPGDVVILLGGRTGRDGCGGATGSSKSHTKESLESCGAEVQKGNAPEERKIQRLFRNKEVSTMIKRCNDFGAGGVCVAIGELADGVSVDLDAVPKKYEGLNGTELAISESQERMAVVIRSEDEERFLHLCDQENLEATKVAVVTEEKTLSMGWRGKEIVSLSREFLNSNGAPKQTAVKPLAPKLYEKKAPSSFTEGITNLARDINVASKRGMGERFDSTIGGNTVLMPYGGTYQTTPIQAMVHKIPLEKGVTDTCSFFSWGYNPCLSEQSPYHGAYLAVVESVSKLIATGAEFKDVYLSFQEYFEKPKKDPARWGKPFAALLGAFDAQMDLKVAAIGGKDSMSGTFEQIDVPPTLISFAVTTGKVQQVISPEFKGTDHKVVLLAPKYQQDGIPDSASLLEVFETVFRLVKEGKAISAYTIGFGGIGEAVMKMCFGNKMGFAFEQGVDIETLFSCRYGSFVLELTGEEEIGIPLGRTREGFALSYQNEEVSLKELLSLSEQRLESVYPAYTKQPVEESVPAFTYKSGVAKKSAATFVKPKVVIPVFFGTNCEYDAKKAFEEAGAEVSTVIMKNLTARHIEESIHAFAKEIKESQMIFIPGGFSGGDEPDGSAKFITAFFRNPVISDAVMELLNKRQGLMAGICNGFQALIKLGLLPYGEILPMDETKPTLTYNTIGRHQSKIVRTRVCSNLSPWLKNAPVGEVYHVPISHGEGRFLCSEELLKELARNGQIATQYVDLEGNPTYDIQFNPNGSVAAVEGITSKDGRIFGKMGHSERKGKDLYKNVPGNYDMGMFAAAVEYFK